ncbi:hypothetical protein PMAYCL1PPCAC_27865, partial [Pristionchus mayeri]
QLWPFRPFTREVYNIVKNFNIDRLILDCEGPVRALGLVTSPFFPDLAKACKRLEILSLNHCGSIPTDLYELYKVMTDGSSKLRYFEMELKKGDICEFLERVGIIEKYGVFFSNRNIETFEDPIDMDTSHIHLFDGNMQIWSAEKTGQKGHMVHICRHNSTESLDKAKYGGKLVRVDI